MNRTELNSIHSFIPLKGLQEKIYRFDKTFRAVRLLGLLWLGSSLHQGHQERSQTAAVDNLCARGLGVVQPDHRQNLDGVEKADRAGQEGKGVLHEVDGAENDPVGHPLCGVSVNVLASLQGLEGHVRGVDEANKVRCELHSSRDQYQGDQKGDAGGEKQDLGVSRLLLELLEFLCNKKNGKDESTAAKEKIQMVW